MQFSERMAHIKPSATLTINAKALELKSQGVDVTSLAIGEPNSPPPAHVCDAAKQAIDEGFPRYTAVPGIPPLREAIAGYFKRAYGVDVAPDCTIASNGGKQSLYNLFAALLAAVYAETMARVRRCPAMPYLVIAILPMLPGAGVYYTMSLGLEGKTMEAVAKGLETLGIAGSLAVGILLVSTVFRLVTWRGEKAGKRA